MKCWRQHYLTGRYTDLKRLYSDEVIQEFGVPHELGQNVGDTVIVGCQPSPKTLVFVQRRDTAFLVHKYLRLRGFNVGVVTGLSNKHEWSTVRVMNEKKNKRKKKSTKDSTTRQDDILIHSLCYS